MIATNSGQKHLKKVLTVMLNNLRDGKKLFSFYIPVLIAAVYLVLAIASVQYDDITFDESAHLLYGIQIIKGNPDRSVNEERFRSTMPVSALNALPRAVEQLLHPGTKKNDWGKDDVKNGRYITILLTLVLLFYCFRFSASLTSDKVGCVIMSFIAFDPNVLAHSRLVTTDIYAAIGFIATIYHLGKWLSAKEPRQFYYWCIAIAVAQCCKPNNVLLYPISLIPVIFYAYKNKVVFIPKNIVFKILVFAVIQVVIINAFFLFSGPWGCSLAQLHVRSGFFTSLQASWVAKIPLPFSKAYIETFDLVQYERETFDGTALNYLAGELRYKKGFWNYYLICYGLKTPLISILLTVTGIIYSLVFSKIRMVSLIFCCWPCLFVFIFLSNSSIQNGYRYLIPVTCLSLIFTSWLLEAVVKKIPEITLLCFSFIPLLTAIMAFPNYLAYSNMLVAEKKLAYRFLADSSFNWGQRNSALQNFLSVHPDYIFEPSVPVTGMIVVDLNNLAGIKTPEKFKWLRENYVPVATIDDCYLIYNVKQLPAGK